MAEVIKESLGYTLYFGIILLGCLKKNNRRFAIVVCVYMWFLIAFSNDTADYFAYEEMYLCAFEPRYAGHEPGFMTLCRICLFMGLPYICFRCIVSLLIIFLVYKGLSYYTDQVCFALALFLIFPFLGFASGLRQACSCAVVVFCSRFLVRKGRKETLKYLIGIGIATLFHYSSIFYVIFLWAKYKKTRNLVLFIQCVAFVAAILIVSQTGLIYSFASKITNREKTLNWLRSQGLYISPLYIIAIGLLVVFVFGIYQARIVISRKHYHGDSKKINLETEEVDILSRAIVLSMISFGGAVFNSVVFLRLVLTLIPVGYAACAEGVQRIAVENEIGYRKSLEMRCGLIVFCILVTLFVFGYWIGGDVLAVPVKNYLFGS